VSYELSAALFSLGLFAGVLLALVIGRAVGMRRMRNDAEGARAGVRALQGAVFGQMGLLYAFTI